MKEINGSILKLIDWDIVAKEYSGIEICPFQHRSNLEDDFYVNTQWVQRSIYDWYRSWDVASGCVWKKDGIKSITEIPKNTVLPTQNEMEVFLKEEKEAAERKTERKVLPQPEPEPFGYIDGEWQCMQATREQLTKLKAYKQFNTPDECVEAAEAAKVDILSIIKSPKSTLRELIKIINNNFNDLKSTLLLFNILNFATSHIPTRSVFSTITDNKITYRLSVISRGTKILFNKYNMILSNLLTFVYFFVKYLKNTGKDLSKIYNFDDEAYSYINNYMPLPPVILYNMNTPLEHFNSIQEHVMSGGRHFHLFISSSEKILPGYISRVIHNAKPGDIPVIIQIKISSKNPAILTQQEDDHVLSSFIPSEFINSIHRIGEGGEIGQEIDLKTLDFFINST